MTKNRPYRDPVFSASELLELAGAPVRSASTSQRRSKFAFSPRESATAAIDTPGRRHAATASALNASLWRRRRRRTMPIDCSEVFTCPPVCWVDTIIRVRYAAQEGDFAGRLQPAASKQRHYVGKRSLTLPENVRPDRLQLVGLAGEGVKALPVGSHLRLSDSNAPTDGWITSGGRFSTDERPIALAMLRAGRSQKALHQLLEDAFEGSTFRTTNVSQALVRIEVRGPEVRALLLKSCALDLYPSQFPPGRCVRTRSAALPTVLRCTDPTNFECIVASNYQDYMLSWLADAAAEFPV